jgi:anti-anti-sigma factor
VVGEADKRSVMIDLAGVDIIDAAGLGLFAFLHSLGYALGFELQLTNPTFRICELLELTRLDSVLDISRSEGVGGRGVALAPRNYPFFPLLDGWSTRS